MNEFDPLDSCFFFSFEDKKPVSDTNQINFESLRSGFNAIGDR